MEDTRKGFLTPEQEKKIDALMEFKGLMEAFDGTAIKLADNVGLQKLKEKIVATNPELLETIYQIVDEIVAALPDEPIVVNE